MKSCIQCKYFSQGISDPRMLCKNKESIIGYNQVTGVVTYFTCSEMRESYKCGDSGKLFVADDRNTFLVWLKNWFVN